MGAAPKIEIFQNGQLLQEIPLLGEMWVGRDEACPVHLDDRAISRKHGLFRTNSKGEVEFENRSKFGWVRVNGQELVQATLKEGDRLELGPFELRVKSESSAVAMMPSEALPVADTIIAMTDDQEENQVNEQSALGIETGLPPEAISIGTEDFAQVESDGATKVFSIQDEIKAVIFFGPNNANVEHYELGTQEISIGRSQQCHVVLADKRSSRKHALIRLENKKYILRDLGSANGTQVNDLRVEGEIELNSGDRIQIGDTTFTFQMVQADYEQKKEQFINVPPQEEPVAPPPAYHSPFPPMEQIDHGLGQSKAASMGAPAASPAFEPISEAKKPSLLGSLINRYRMLSTKQQILYGLVILGGLYLFLDEEPEPVSQVQTQKKVKKAAEVKTGGLPSIETLSKEQQHYIETQYQLGLDLYKNREYDKAIFELEKIFSMVQDYQSAREVHSYAIEGKRQLEIREEDRKRKEKETQDKIKLAALVSHVGSLMDKKKFKEAESMFPEIEILEPENAAVSAWRKAISSENDRIEEARKEKLKNDEIYRLAMDDFKKGKVLQNKKMYYDSIDQFEEILDRKIVNKKLNKDLENEIATSYRLIAEIRDPFLAKGKELEESGNFRAAYHAYEEALKADPETEEAPKGMKRIHGALTDKAKSLYTEAVFAESFNDFETAEKKYMEVLEAVPVGDDYHVKAQLRLKKITIFKKPVTSDSTGIPQ